MRPRPFTPQDSAHKDLPGQWLTPVLHSVYLHAMINFVESRVEDDALTEHTTEFRPGLHSYLQTYNLLKELRFPTTLSAGFEFGLSVPAAAHGAMGQAAVTSANLGDALATIAEFTPLRNNLVRYHYSEQVDSGTLEIEPLFDMADYAEVIHAATVATFVQMVTFLTGPRGVSGLVVETPWTLDPQRLIGGELLGEVQFAVADGGQVASIVLPAALLGHRNATRDALLYAQACNACRSELAQLKGSCSAEVKAYLQGLPCADWPILADVARDLAMSRRTLIRKLAAEGTSFQALADEIRANLACWRLETTRIPIGELAFSLGFADESNFSRTFRRWRGVTPSRYRNRFARRMA